jgi:hypothetical protein
MTATKSPALPLTLIRAVGAYMTSKTLNRNNSAMPEVTKNFKIKVFLEKCLGSIYC